MDERYPRWLASSPRSGGWCLVALAAVGVLIGLAVAVFSGVPIFGDWVG